MIINPTIQTTKSPDLTEILRLHKINVVEAVNCVQVGVIQAFDAGDQTATVQIALQQILSIAQDGTRQIAQYPLLLKVPVLFPSGGGFTLTFPINIGDECLVLFNDSERENWFLSGVGGVPNTLRVHDLSDGFAIVGLRNSTRSLGGVSTGTAQLRSDDGGTFVEVAAGGIVTITAPTEIVMNTPLVTINGVINVVNSGSVTDPVTITGTIKTTGDVIAGAGNISLINHVHSGVQSGGSNTGAPV